MQSNFFLNLSEEVDLLSLVLFLFCISHTASCPPPPMPFSSLYHRAMGLVSAGGWNMRGVCSALPSPSASSSPCSEGECSQSSCWGVLGVRSWSRQLGYLGTKSLILDPWECTVSGSYFKAILFFLQIQNAQGMWTSKAVNGTSRPLPAH